MEMKIDYKDVKLYRNVNTGFKGFYTVDGDDHIPYEVYKECKMTSSFLDDIYKSETLQELIKGIPEGISHSLIFEKDEIRLEWVCSNGYIGKFTWKFQILLSRIISEVR